MSPWSVVNCRTVSPVGEVIAASPPVSSVTLRRTLPSELSLQVGLSPLEP